MADAAIFTFYMKDNTSHKVVARDDEERRRLQLLVETYFANPMLAERYVSGDAYRSVAHAPGEVTLFFRLADVKSVRMFVAEPVERVL